MRQSHEPADIGAWLVTALATLLQLAPVHGVGCYAQARTCHRAGRTSRSRGMANRTRRRNLGHSMWLGAGHDAACRRPLRKALNVRIVRSNSSALAASIRRSMRGCPSGANIRAISSSEKPARRPSAISASRSTTRDRTGAASLAGQSTRSTPCPHRTAASRPEGRTAATLHRYPWLDLKST